jgi:hypothetical protein
LTILATLSLATALACGGTVVGCGSSNSGTSSGGNTDSGTDSSNTLGDGGKDVNVADTNVADTFVADTFVAEATLPVCPTPTLAPAGGADPGNVTITDTGLPTGGFIYYTTDGTNPTVNSPVYSNPIQVSQDETIRADAIGSGCSLSAVAVGTYTVTPFDGGMLTPVVFNPTSETQPNDFIVSLSTMPSSALICYTLDGTMPTCNTAGTMCEGTSQPYSAASRVSINGTVTDATTGQVTVTAISCEAGFNSSAPQSQIYTLQAAPPTMINPTAATNIPWVPGGFTPTISSITVASIAPANAPAIWATVDGAAPTCVTGTNLTNPTTFGTGTGVTALLTGNHTYQALTCKTGYLPSAVQTFAYTFQLNNVSVSGTGTYNYAPTVALTTATPPVVPGITDPNRTAAIAPPASEYLCYDLAGAATCGAAGACGTGSTKYTVGVVAESKTSAATTLSVIACDTANGATGGINNAAAAGSATYTLQYAAPWLWTSNSAAQPGWDYLGTGAVPGQPSTALNLPASAGATWTTATPNVYQVGDVGGQAVPANTQLPANNYVGFANGADPTGTRPWSAAVSTFPNYQVPDYLCWQYCAKGATCGTLTCGTGGACVTAAGKSGQVTFADAVNGSNEINGLAGISAGDSISMIGCENAPSNPASEFVYNASAVTTVTFSAAGGATQPTVSAPTATPYNVQATPTITNNDTSSPGATICWTYASTAVTPTCTAGTCGTPTLTGNDAAEGSLTLAPKGSPQNFTISAVTKSPGNHVNLTVGSTTGFAVGMPVVVAGNGTPNNNGVFILTAAGGTTLTYVNAAAGAVAAGGTVSAYTVATFGGGTGNGTQTFPTPSPFADSPPLGLIQRDGYVLSAIACTSVEASSPASSQTYNFTAGKPDFSSTPSYTADLDNGGSIGAGSPVWLSSVSNFNSTRVAPETTEAIFYASAGTVACGSAGEIDLQNVVLNPAGTALVDVWDNGGTPPTNQIGPAGNVLVTAPTTGASWTLSAITCGESTTAQQSSGVRTETFTLNAAIPTVLTNQDPTAGNCGAAPLPACCPAGKNTTSCTPQPKWEHSFQVAFTSPTPGSSICYSTSMAPTCNGTTGKCTGAGVVQVNTGATLAIANSPTTLYVQGCGANLGVPAGQTYPFDVFTTPPTLVLPAGGVCSTSSNPSIELATAVASPVDKTDIALGGPTTLPATNNTCVCFTTDKSAAQCVASSSGACNYLPAGTVAGNGTGGPPGTTVTCFNANANGLNSATIPVTTTTTINMSTCSFGLDTTSASQVYQTGAYTHTIKVDGDIGEWTQTAEAAGMRYDIEDDHGFCSAPPANAFGLFTYDNANLYFGGSIGGNLSGACCNYNGGCQHGACVGNAGTWIVGYVGNNSGAGASFDLSAVEPNRINDSPRPIDPAAGIQYAFAYNTSGTPATVTTYVWSASPAGWSAVSPQPTISAAMDLTTNTFEFGIPFSAVGVTSASTVTFFATGIADVGIAQTLGDGSNTLFSFPGTTNQCGTNGCLWWNYVEYYEANLGSCLTPNNNVANVSGGNSGGLIGCFGGP